MACNIETVAYPSWWDSATTVDIAWGTGSAHLVVPRAAVEMLPQGVAWDNSGSVFMIPWGSVNLITKDS